MKKVGFVAVIAICLSSCTQPGETTGVGAAAGGVIGAGLGAIVGSQTGNAGSGLVIGAAAGAGTGALVANALQAQQETLHAQDEAIERQEQVIRAQKSEIDELRRMNPTGEYTRPQKTSRLNAPSAPAGVQKSSALSSTASLAGSASSTAGITPASAPSSSSTPVLPSSRHEAFDSSVSASPKSGFREKDFNAASGSSSPSSERASYKPEVTAAKSSGIGNTGTSECVEAQAEVTKANALQESADKLFHLRRALRLCPGNASYHNALGELYLKLDRKDDARYEFDEALKLEPGNRQAQANVEYLKTK